MHPVLVGSGTPVFRSGLLTPLQLTSTDARQNGVVSLSYTKAHAA
jgi:hypothetical protein